MRFIGAQQVFDGEDFLPNNSVLVLDKENILKEIIRKDEIAEGKIEFLDGIVSPGFVNAHCHLELSHLKNKIPQRTGLPNFARHVITQRNNFKQEEIFDAAKIADADMWSSGIVAVGDISNSNTSFKIKSESAIHYHTFVELVGFNPVQAETTLNTGYTLLEELKTLKLTGSLAPHAPYSASTELIKRISTFNYRANLPFSIHNQESEDETLFFHAEENGFYNLYRFLNLDISWFKAPKVSSLKNYAKFLNTNPSILVHNTYTELEDVKFVRGKNIYWCFCPGANLYIEGRLPNYTLFENIKKNHCIGTDSLASNTQLNLIDELNIILKNSRTFSLSELLRAITYNGSKALNLDHNYGKLIVGKNVGLNQIKNHTTHLEFIKKIA